MIARSLSLNDSTTIIRGTLPSKDHIEYRIPNGEAGLWGIFACLPLAVGIRVYGALGLVLKLPNDVRPWRGIHLERQRPCSAIKPESDVAPGSGPMDGREHQTWPTQSRHLTVYVYEGSHTHQVYYL